MQHDSFVSRADDRPPVLVVGGGVAGLRAAQNLADLGIPVVLAERDGHLGGQVMRLDKVYPTDHCAFCPVWTPAKRCYEHPLIEVRLHTNVASLEHENGRIVAVLDSRLPAVDPSRCLFCGACLPVCPEGALRERDPLMTWDPALPPAVRIDTAACTDCGACAAACPVGAIDLHRQNASERIVVGDVVWATGFEEPGLDDAAYAPEFGAHTHKDICTAMEFEAWSCESRTCDPLLTRAEGKPVRRVAFIQCAGARDVRHLSYCAAVCCMHAMKQARWLKRRQPDLEATVFYTDLRAPGKAQEVYIREGRADGVVCIHSRPGMVLPAPTGGIAVRYEDPVSGRTVTDVFDMVVVNGGLKQCALPGKRDDRAIPADRVCGFCAEPADIAQSVMQADDLAARVALRRAKSGGDA